jgi:hypothetical protein
VSIRARLERVAAQIAEGLAQQDLVTLHEPEFPGDPDVAAARAHLPADLFRCALSDSPHVHGAEHQLGGLREIQKVGYHLPECLGFIPDTLDVGSIVPGKAIEVEQAAVTVNRRKAIAEFVRDSRGEFSEPREAVLQP